MAVSPPTVGSEARNGGLTSDQFSDKVKAFLARFGRGAKSTLTTLQTARMMSVLSDMSDQQLAQIGISRSDIPEYAERLILEE